MKKQFLGLIFCPLISVGCASKHFDHKAEKVSGDAIEGLIVSGADITGTQKEAFSMIALTFENTTGEWIRIEKAEVMIGKDLADRVSSVVGKDLEDWASAIEARAILEKQNREMTHIGFAYGSAALAIAGATSNGNGSEATLFGAAAYTLTLDWAMLDLIKWSKADAQNPKALPQNHIERSFSIPGKLFLRRWVLLNKPLDARITEIPLKISLIDGRTTTLLVNLKKVSK